eukprot:gene26943-33595_t
MWRYGKSLRPYFEDVKQIVQNKNSYFQLANNSVPVVDSANLTFDHCPIVDCGITDDDRVLDLCRKLVEDISRGEIIYLHCWGGHGRTGTVVSIMLHLMYGMSASEAMARCQLAHDLRVCPVNVGSPQTQTQRDQVTRIITGLEADYRRQQQADLGSLLTPTGEVRTGGLIGLPVCDVAFSSGTTSEKSQYLFVPSPNSPHNHHKMGTPVENHSLHVTLQKSGAKGLIGANGIDHMYTLAVNSSPHAAVYTQSTSTNPSCNNSSGENSPTSPQINSSSNGVVQNTVREQHGAIPPPLPMVRRGPTSMFSANGTIITPNSNSSRKSQPPPQLTQQQMNFASLIASSSGSGSEVTPRGGATTPTLRYEVPTFGASDDSLATLTNSSKTSPDVKSSKFSGSGFNQMQSRGSPFENLSRENSGSLHNSSTKELSPGGADSPLQLPSIGTGLQTSSSDYGYGLYEPAHALEALHVNQQEQQSLSPVLSPIAVPGQFSEEEQDFDESGSNSLQHTPQEDAEMEGVESTERLSAASLLFFDQQHHYMSRSRPMSVNQDSETDTTNGTYATSANGYAYSNGAASGNNSISSQYNGNTTSSTTSTLFVSSGTSNGIAGKPPTGASASSTAQPAAGNLPVRLVVNTSDPHRRRDDAGNDSDGEASSQHVRKATNTNSTPTFVTRPPQHTTPTSSGSTISQVLNVARQVLSGRRSPSTSKNASPSTSNASTPTNKVPTPPTTNAPTQRNAQRKIDSSSAKS